MTKIIREGGRGGGSIGSKILIVDPVGGNFYLTPTAAKAVAVSGDLIIVNPGTYTEQYNLEKDGVNWHFHQGARIYNTGGSKMWAGSGSISYRVSGHGEFVSDNNFVVDVSSYTGGTVEFDCKLMDCINFSPVKTGNASGPDKLVIKNTIISSGKRRVILMSGAVSGVENNPQDHYFDNCKIILYNSINSVNDSAALDITYKNHQRFNNCEFITYQTGTACVMFSGNGVSGLITDQFTEFKNCNFKNFSSDVSGTCIELNGSGDSQAGATVYFTGSSLMYNESGDKSIYYSTDVVHREVYFGGDVLANQPIVEVAQTTPNVIYGGSAFNTNSNLVIKDIYSAFYS